MNFKSVNRITGWAVFLIATIVYLLTIEPTASFWDCGEFIATAFKLQVGHPPGAPLFALIYRMFSMFAGAENAAYIANASSGLCASFSILFLFWSITILGKKFFARNNEKLTDGNIIAIMAAGAVGALVYTFSDSFWFSAVEGEVYAMSSLFTAVVFWAILKYDEVADEPHSIRWLALIAYLMGLSIGVHLLNLLAIPAIAFVYYFRNYETTRKGTIYTSILAVVILGIVQGGIIPGTVKLASKFELVFVNGFGMPFFSGVIVFIALLISAIFYGLHVTRKNGKTLWNTVISCTALILIGYSTFTMIVIRSQANTPMDENDPEDMFSLLSYINREQYGDRPLVYGQYWMAPLDAQQPRTDGNPVHTAVYKVMQGERAVATYKSEFDAEQFIAKQANPKLSIEPEYIVSDEKIASEQNYNKDFCSLFPRMYSPQANHIKEYKKWSDFKGKPVRARVNGETKVINVPTLGENIRFLVDYQFNWMYWRYFMWNFAGRQNDIQGHGNILDGNWLSGVDFIDAERLGTRDNLPSSFTTRKAYNRFFLFPLILGIMGLIFQFVRNPRMFTVVALLFLLTGVAIVIYLNQYPLQPRERDYAYAASFYAFAIWVGFGILALYELGKNADFSVLKKIAPIALGSGVVLYLLESIGGSDHGNSFTILYMSSVALAMIIVTILVGKASKNAKTVAFVALIIGLPVPIIMGMEGWNDHSRAKRETGVAFAKNYLESCAENAILFTNGDNDTFPLWYVQEVEGFRTDVRVVNLSLLNTDWYVTQMKRKAYKSEPVPFSLTEPQYRQGTRDIVLLDNSRNKQGIFIDVDQVMKYCSDDKNRVPVQGGELMSVIPTKTFAVSVDKQKVLNNGTVSIADTANIVDRLEWSINKSYLLKSQLLVIDLLATNNWERPIYFAVTTGRDAYLGLEKYFQLEGLAYRLIPVESKSTSPYAYGRVATDIMFDNVMNKFEWGGMDDENIFMDENNLRMTTNLRLQFANLADEFIKEKDNQKAIAVLDRAMEVMPERNVPFDRILTPIIESYYRAGDSEKGAALSKRLFDIQLEEMIYYQGLEGNFKAQVKDEIRVKEYTNERLAALAQQNGQEAIAKEMEEALKAYKEEVQLNSVQKISM
jgi:hypothetical protein